MLTFIAFVLVIGLLVFVHEFGHFIMARKKGVRVEEFAFGFPPRLWSKKKGDTLYAINLIPIGGYVKLYGEHEEDAKNPESLASKSALDRALIIVAGVVMNFLLAFVILTILYIVGFKALIPGMADHAGVKNDQKIVISEVQKDTPAEKEGLEKGDIVKTVDGQAVYISNQMLSIINTKIRDNKEEKIRVEVLRDGQILEKNIQTFTDKIQNGKEQVSVQRVGITLDVEGKIQTSVLMAPVVAAQETIRFTKMTFVGMYKFFEQLATKFTLSKEVGGPVEIISYTGAFAKMGILALLQFTAILSISLAVINILPIPALDGGHLLFIIIEKVLGREIPAKWKNSTTLIGFVLLLGLMVVLTARGISKLF